MSNRPSLDDYVDVAERIQNFKDTNPDGSLQTISWEIKDVGGKLFIVYHAAAYRTPEDPRPGHGISWEPFPGQTPYTKQSELMNAETAAWGRAIIATGEASKGSLASRQEVRNRRAEQDMDPSPLKTKPAGKAKPTAPKPKPAPTQQFDPVTQTLTTPTEAPQEGAQSATEPVDAVVVEPAKEIVNDITIKGLRATIEASGKTDDDVAWCLLSVGVESLPADPSREDLKAAMATMTVDQALRLDELLTDDKVPGSGEAA